MTIRDVEIWRDGGTITFAVDGGQLAGSYRLRTPFAGELRLLFQDEHQLEPGGETERALLSELRVWFAAQLSPDLESNLARLDALPIWRNLPDEMVVAVPLHHVRTVIRCLEARAA